MDHLAAIRAFQRIVETRSFTKAAAHLDMPRSTLSKALRDLEVQPTTAPGSDEIVAFREPKPPV